MYDFLIKVVFNIMCFNETLTTIFVFARSTTPQNWEDFSRYNKDRAEAQMAASRALREASHHTLQQTDNDLQAQDTATNYAFRKRMHEMKRALNELKNQKEQVNIINWDISRRLIF